MVDSRISQLNDELQMIKSQHKAEVSRQRKQLDEEKAKAQEMAARVRPFVDKIGFERMQIF